MIGIGALIGIASTVFQALNRPESSTSKADKLFSELDVTGNGAIDGADLQSAFDKIAEKATSKAEKLFSRLDADGDGKVTKEEFSGSINQLAEQLDQHFMRMRMHGQADNAGFTREEMTGLAANLANNFDKADADGNGRVSLKEAMAFQKANAIDPSSTASGNQDVELMLQVVRLMQAYGISQVTDNKATKVSTSA